MALMERLTDTKPIWSRQVFDEAVVAEWRTEALEQPEVGLFNEVASKEGNSEPGTWRWPTKPPRQGRIFSEAAF